MKILFVRYEQKDCNEKPDPQGNAQIITTNISKGNARIIITNTPKDKAQIITINIPKGNDQIILIKHQIKNHI